MLIEIAHDKLYSFRYDRTPQKWRQLFQVASLASVALILGQGSLITTAIALLDRCAIMTMSNDETSDDLWSIWESLLRIARRYVPQWHIPPSFRNRWQSMLRVDRNLSYEIASQIHDTSKWCTACRIHDTARWSRASTSDASSAKFGTGVAVQSSDTEFAASVEIQLVTFTIPVPTAPSLRISDIQRLLDLQEPAKLISVMDHWPALQKWQDIDFWRNISFEGSRNVPVEIGRKYTDTDWQQKIVAFRSFLQSILAQSGILKTEDDIVSEVAKKAVGDAAKGANVFKTLNSAGSGRSFRRDGPDTSDSESPTGSGRTVYLAQHDLLSQFTSLNSDIDLSLFELVRSDLPALKYNFWFGPVGTVTPCHFDTYSNILCQVVGFKLVVLFPPESSDALYPQSAYGPDAPSDALLNTSSVDILKPDFEAFPFFKDAFKVAQCCILGPGDALFIPVSFA